MNTAAIYDGSAGAMTSANIHIAGREKTMVVGKLDCVKLEPDKRIAGRKKEERKKEKNKGVIN